MIGLQRLLDALTFGNHFVGQFQHFPQHEFDPRPMKARSGRRPSWLVLPLFMGHAKVAMQVRVVGNKSLREYPHQHRHGQERAGDFDQRKPFSVVTCGGHGYPLANFSGTKNVTDNGKHPGLRIGKPSLDGLGFPLDLARDLPNPCP